MAVGEPVNPIFRTASLGDLGQIQAIETIEFKKLAYPYFILRQLFELHGSDWMVAELQGEVCGYVLTAIGAGGVTWFLGIAVAGFYHGHGYGRKLLEAALEHCRRRGRVSEIYVTVQPENRVAYDLYEKVGFALFERDHHYFGTDEARDVLVYRL